MQEVTGILAGVFLSGAACLCVGLLLFQRLAIRLERLEYFALAFVAGAACFSQILFVLAAAHLARRSVFIALGVVAIAAAVVLRDRAAKLAAFRPLPRPWKWFFAALFMAFGFVYLVSAMAPEMSPDGAAYHLPFVDRYLRAHGFQAFPGDFYGSLSQGVELLFMPAVSLGGHSSAALVHFLFLIDVPLLMICYGRRFGFPFPAAAAAFLVFASPLAGWDGASAYVDVAAGAVVFAVFYLLQVWEVERDRNLLIVIGILAGFSYAAKYTAAIAIPYALAFVTWKLWRGRKQLLAPLVALCVPALLFILPWMIKNAVQMGNPLAPFANQLFPNPYVHVSFERQYLTYLRHYHLTNWLTAPWELAVKGERLQGFFGPIFLLLPVALLSLRRPAGRRLLLAGTIFALPWFLNIGSRFLIPALPPFALAFALALEPLPAALPAVVILHAFLSWYASPVKYFDRYAPRIAALPVSAALRREPETVYLARTNAGYRIDRMIERRVPPGEKIFSFEPVPQAWTTREIVAGQNGAENEALLDVFRTALLMGSSPVRALDFRFPSARVRRVQAVQTARLSGEMWSVSEFQILEGESPLIANQKWHWNASPDRWDARFAFDASVVTRWRSWQDAAPGMFLEADFGEPEFVDEVRLLTSSDAPHTRVYLRGMDQGGQWRDLSLSPAIATAKIECNRRVEAVRALMAHGVRYLLVTGSAFGANDFAEHAASWGIRLVGEAGGARLYRLEPDRAAPEDAAPVNATREPVPPGSYDDADPRLYLREAWTRDPQFQEAYSHTLSYSNVPGASASLSFDGDAVTYVYTRACNRGIAEVWVDGRMRGQVDLYAAETAWKSRTRYAGLGSGRHIIDIRVSGQKNPRASGGFVDLDALIVE